MRPQRYPGRIPPLQGAFLWPAPVWCEPRKKDADGREDGSPGARVGREPERSVSAERYIAREGDSKPSEVPPTIISQETERRWRRGLHVKGGQVHLVFASLFLKVEYSFTAPTTLQLRDHRVHLHLQRIGSVGTSRTNPNRSKR